MAEINVNKDCKLIKVLAAEARGERLDSEIKKEADHIIAELAKDMSPENKHKIAQTMAYTIEELQKNGNDFISALADVKNIGYGDKAVFNLKTKGLKAFIQAKGATTARSYVAEKQVTVDTECISVRPAVNILQLQTGRVNFADLIGDAYKKIEMAKTKKVQTVLHNAIDDYSSPFYASGTGVVKATLDTQINYFRRLGPVALVGDYAAVSNLNALAGCVMNSGTNTDAFTAKSGNMIDEINANGIIGAYNGSKIVCLANEYDDYSTTPIVDSDWIYILPVNMSADARNLKIVNEGGVYAIEDTNIDDKVYEVCLDQYFGCGFVSGKLPTLGAYKIN